MAQTATWTTSYRVPNTLASDTKAESWRAVRINHEGFLRQD